jgi:hypothetical protein
MNKFHTLANSGQHNDDASIPAMPGIAQDLTDNEKNILQSIVDFFATNPNTGDVFTLLQPDVLAALSDQQQDTLSLPLGTIFIKLQRAHEYIQHPDTLNDSHQLHNMLASLHDMVARAELGGKLMVSL